MGRECSTLYNRLAKQIAEKRELHQSIVTNWIRTKISSALLKSALLYLRESSSISRNVCFIVDSIEAGQKVGKI